MTSYTCPCCADRGEICLHPEMNLSCCLCSNNLTILTFDNCKHSLCSDCYMTPLMRENMSPKDFLEYLLSLVCYCSFCKKVWETSEHLFNATIECELCFTRTKDVQLGLCGHCMCLHCWIKLRIAVSNIKKDTSDDYINELMFLMKQKKSVIYMKDNSLSNHPFFGTIECSDCSRQTNENIKITCCGEYKCSECFTKVDESVLS